MSLKATARSFSEIRLVNGSTGDPVLHIDYPGQYRAGPANSKALLFDAGDLGSIDMKRLAGLQAVFLSHHHFDHFVGFDKVIRANLDHDKTLSVFGPEGTIRRVYARIKSYEIQFFPFQKLVIEVHDLGDGVIRTAKLECARRFPEPETVERSWEGMTIYENADLSVEAVPVEHTVSCFAYALAEKPGFHPDPEKLNRGLLRPGEWVREARRLLREGARADTEMQIQGGTFRLGTVAEQYFSESSGARVAYVTDTIWNETTRPRLIALAKGAWRLYCDSYYALAQAKQAETHKHMTATHAGELAKAAKVSRLVLMHFAPRYAGRYRLLVDEATKVFPRVTAEWCESPDE